MGQGRCKDLDPGVFFPSDWIGVQSAQEICVECQCEMSACDTRSPTESPTACGAECQSGNGAAFFVVVGRE
jgi:hypothetical protein